MKGWPNKFIIGLTGNIATGKSVVRRMLEHLGAFGIDADALGHRAFDPSSPGFDKVIEAFGPAICDDAGYIDRKALGRIVFSDPQALKRLEEILHPLIRRAIVALIENAPQRVIVIEAIKLLKGGLFALCDSIWVTETGQETQLARLVNTRKMRSEDALQRIQSQPPQAQKLAVADVVIRNDTSFESTWEQVTQAWKKLFPETQPTAPKSLSIPNMTMEFARPDQSAQIAAFMTKTSLAQNIVSTGQIMREFSRKTFIMLKIDDKIVGLAGWATINLVGLVDDVHLSPKSDPSQALPLLTQEAENASRSRQCEVNILLIPAHYAKRAIGWEAMGYEIIHTSQLSVRAWVEAVHESELRDAIMFVKRLNMDQVFRV